MQQEVHKDAQNMASVLHTMQSGLSTFEKVFKALEVKYKPFQYQDFKAEFYKGVN